MNKKRKGEVSNALFAKFLGMVYTKNGWEDRENALLNVSQIPNKANGYDQVNFDISFDWLMLVVEKIETLKKGRYSVEIQGKSCNIYDLKKYKCYEYKKNSKFKAAHFALFEFVNEYYQNQYRKEIKREEKALKK